jgi:hypothetical protein
MAVDRPTRGPLLMKQTEPSPSPPIERSLNEASRWRLAMARAIAPVYTRNPRARAVIVAGSVGRGCADPYSDVEVGVFWEELPAPGELQAAMESARGTGWELDPYNPDDEVWYEEYVAGGLKIDLRHMTVARMEEVLAAVVDEGDLSQSDRQQIVFAVQQSVTLHGATLIEQWRMRAARYPDRLALAMVVQYAAFPPWWPVSMYAERGDLPMLYGAFHEATRRILGVLLGLNRIYDPGLKWIDRTLALLEDAPPNLAARLKEAFRAEPTAGARQMQQLIEETFDQVEQQMPAIDIAAVRHSFRFCRPILNEAPPGWLQRGEDAAKEARSA